MKSTALELYYTTRFQFQTNIFNREQAIISHSVLDEHRVCNMSKTQSLCLFMLYSFDVVCSKYNLYHMLISRLYVKTQIIEVYHFSEQLSINFLTDIRSNYMHKLPCARKIYMHIFAYLHDSDMKVPKLNYIMSIFMSLEMFLYQYMLDFFLLSQYTIN